MRSYDMQREEILLAGEKLSIGDSNVVSSLLVDTEKCGWRGFSEPLAHQL